MPTISNIVHQLETQRKLTQQELEKLNLAIRALTSLGGTSEPTVRRKNRMSAKGRASIAKAQRERWAKLKSKTGPKPGKKKYKMSRKGRLAIARAKKAWWAKKKAAQKK